MTSFWAAVFDGDKLPRRPVISELHPWTRKAGVYTELTSIRALQSELLAMRSPGIGFQKGLGHVSGEGELDSRSPCGS